MRRSKKKSFREFNQKPCGERSPYWTWLEKHSRNAEGEIVEPAEGNPDILAEECNIYTPRLSGNAHDKLETIQESLRKLSRRERIMVEMCGYDGLSVEQTALKLKIAVSTVKNTLARARRKIQKIHVVHFPESGTYSRPT